MFLIHLNKILFKKLIPTLWWTVSRSHMCARDVPIPQIYKGDPEPGSLYPSMGLKLGVFGFPMIKITVVRQVHMSPTPTAVEHENKMCDTLHDMRRYSLFVLRFVLRLFLCMWLAKTWRPPFWAVRLTTPLHGAVYEVWDLSCISVAHTLVQQPQDCIYVTAKLEIVYRICDALPQNREQVIFWIKWDFSIIVRSTLCSFNLIPKSSSYSSYFFECAICVFIRP